MRASQRLMGALFLAALIAAVPLASGVCYATSIFVAPTPGPFGLGTFEDPMTFAAGMIKARDDMSVTEVIVRGGTYYVSQPEYPDGVAGEVWEPDPGPGPNLTVKAYTNETPIFDNATQVTSSNSTPVPDLPGVYSTTETPAGTDENNYAYVWETDTPLFYAPLQDLASCAAFKGSTFYDRTARLVYFHTSDDQPPDTHTIYSSHNKFNRAGLYVWRANTTIDGLTFKNFVAGPAIATYAAGVTVRNCKFDYCMRSVETNSGGITVECCEGVNTAQGPYSKAQLGTVFRNNKFTKSRDPGMIPIDWQDDCGYQVYFDGVGATIEYNFAKGYVLGTYIKTLPGTYNIRHNTFVFCAQGIGSAGPLSMNSNVSYNVVALAPTFQTIKWDGCLIYGNNSYWDVNKTTQEGQDSFVTSGDPGINNVFGDPRFFDPKNGDYHLLPGSPVPKDGCIPAGAFGYVSVAEASSAKPTIRLDLSGWVRPYRPEFSSLDPDFWSNESGSTSVITANPDLPLRLAISTSLTLGVTASPAVPVLQFTGWTTNPSATVSVAAPSQQTTSVTATTDGTITANWEQAP